MILAEITNIYECVTTVAGMAFSAFIFWLLFKNL